MKKKNWLKDYAKDGKSVPPSNLWETDKTAWMDSVMNESSYIPWVKNTYDPKVPKPDLEFYEGDENKFWVAPSVQHYYQGMAVPFDTDDKASYFLNNYDVQRTPIPHSSLKERFPDSYKENGGKVAKSGKRLKGLTKAQQAQVAQYQDRLPYPDMDPAMVDAYESVNKARDIFKNTEVRKKADELYKRYNEQAAAYLSRPEYKNSPLKAEHIAEAAKKLYEDTNYEFPLDLALAQGQFESGLGTHLKTKNNVWNVGNYGDGTRTREFDSPAISAYNYMQLMYDKYLNKGQKNVDELLQKGMINTEGNRYDPTNPKYEEVIGKQIKTIRKRIPGIGQSYNAAGKVSANDQMPVYPDQSVQLPMAKNGTEVPPFITSDIDEYNYRKARQLDSNYLNKNLKSYFNKNAEKFRNEHTVPYDPYASKLNPFGTKTYSNEEANNMIIDYNDSVDKNRDKLLENISRNLQIRKIPYHQYDDIEDYMGKGSYYYFPRPAYGRDNRTVAHVNIPFKGEDGKWHNAEDSYSYHILDDFPAATQEVIFDSKAPKSTGNKKAVSKPVPKAPLERVSVSQVPVADMQQFPVPQSAQQYANYAQVPASPYSVNVHKWDPILLGKMDEVKNFMTQEQLEAWKKANRAHALGTGRYEVDINQQPSRNDVFANVEQMKNGGMIKRADGSYSQRGLWDNIRANAGSGKKPTKEMLKQEKKIRAKEKAKDGKYIDGVYNPSAEVVDKLASITPKQITPEQMQILQMQAKQNQSTIRPASKKRGAVEKAGAIARNPITAAQYVVQGKPIPDYFEKGARNPYDYAADVLNPMTYVDAAKRTATLEHLRNMHGVQDLQGALFNTAMDAGALIGLGSELKARPNVLPVESPTAYQSGELKVPPQYMESNVAPHYPYSSIEKARYGPGWQGPARSRKAVPLTPENAPYVTEVPELTKEQEILKSFGLDPNKTKVPEDIVSLYRAQPVGQNPNMNVAAKLRAKKAAGENLTWYQERLLNPENPEMIAREKYYGQWFEKDPNRLDWYLDPVNNNFDKDDVLEILKYDLPKSEAMKYSVTNFADADKLSRSNQTEFIVPKDLIEKAKRYPTSDLQKLINEHKSFSEGDLIYDINSPTPEHLENVKAEIAKGNQWIENWYNHPRIKKRLGFNAEAGERQRGFSDPLNMIEGITEEKLGVKLGDELEREVIRRQNRRTQGISSGHQGESFVYSDAVNPKSVAIHEGTHQVTDLERGISNKYRKLLGSIADKDQLLNRYDDLLEQESASGDFNPDRLEQKEIKYLSHPSEVHARINQLREHYNFDPNRKIDEKTAKSILKDIKTGKTPVSKKFAEVIENSSDEPYKNLANVFNKMFTFTGVGAGIAGATYEGKKQYGGKVNNNWLQKY